MNGNNGNENDDTSLFEPIDINYTQDNFYGNLTCDGYNNHNINNNNNTSNRRDETVSLRFSDISMETEQILNDIISEEEKRMSHEQQGGYVPSVTLTTTTVMDDDPDDFEPIPVMTGGSRGGDVDGGQQQQRRSSSIVITMRPSLMSPQVANKMMEGIMKIDSTTNKVKDFMEGIMKIDSNTTTTTTTTTTNNTNKVKDHYPQEQQQRPQKMSRRTHNRFSISADPTDFGPGGCDGGTASSLSTTQVMRYSILRDTLDMFDEPDHNEDENCGSDSDQSLEDSTEKEKEKLQVRDIQKETVLRLPNITAEIHECHEDLLAQEMDKLSFDEKHKIMFEVHGIPTLSTALTGSATSQHTTTTNNKNADPVAPFQHTANEMQIERCLQQVTLELREPKLTQILLADPKFGNGMTKTEARAEEIAAAYQEAAHLNPQYVTQKRLRLTFLLYQMHSSTKPIAETTTAVEEDDTDDASQLQYYAQATAGHLAYHFWKKKELFGGGAVLARDIRLSDLSADDREALDSGGMQLMPHRDAAGRCVLMCAPDQKIYRTNDNWIRAVWYMFWAVTKDSADLVQIVNGPGRSDNVDMFQKYNAVFNAFPITLKAIHWCYDNVNAKPLIIAKKVHFYTSHDRSHFREHYVQDHTQMCFRLESYGIPIDKTIFLPNGRLGLEWHQEWIQYRESIEKEEEDRMNAKNGTTDGSDRKSASFLPVNDGFVPGTIIVNNYDVLFGRGKNTREHTGNLRCAYWVELHCEEYDTARKALKTKIAEKIVTQVLESGGRFLKKDKKKIWHEVERKEARNKVAHFFRHLREKTPKTTTTMTTTTTTMTNNGNENESSNQKRSLETDGQLQS